MKYNNHKKHQVRVRVPVLLEFDRIMDVRAEDTESAIQRAEREVRKIINMLPAKLSWGTFISYQMGIKDIEDIEDDNL